MSDKKRILMASEEAFQNLGRQGTRFEREINCFQRRQAMRHEGRVSVKPGSFFKVAA